MNRKHATGRGGRLCCPLSQVLTSRMRLPAPRGRPRRRTRRQTGLAEVRGTPRCTPAVSRTHVSSWQRVSTEGVPAVDARLPTSLCGAGHRATSSPKLQDSTACITTAAQKAASSALAAAERAIVSVILRNRSPCRHRTSQGRHAIRDQTLLNIRLSFEPIAHKAAPQVLQHRPLQCSRVCCFSQRHLRHKRFICV